MYPKYLKMTARKYNDNNARIRLGGFRNLFKIQIEVD